ncbi:hypothetical protein HPB48_026378 [Haemaphysalis longicornis]|uniref:CCHC-type domain-containing protein n=1 Tax=Haemaphysalis longicornis TaxID=44386 RepID=A0A9J6H9I6_HAELO|nr:hypothetical protein HPB48_026378 [Haemaphysalis longicornis]
MLPLRTRGAASSREVRKEGSRRTATTPKTGEFACRVSAIQHVMSRTGGVARGSSSRRANGRELKGGGLQGRFLTRRYNTRNRRGRSPGGPPSPECSSPHVEGSCDPPTTMPPHRARRAMSQPSQPPPREERGPRSMPKQHPAAHTATPTPKPHFVRAFTGLKDEILHVRRLGTCNKVRLTFSGKVKPRYVSYDALLIPVQPYKKTVPACGRCGSVGHRPDACPGPKPDLCGICGKAVPLTDGARAPHGCTPRCVLCARSHVTGDRRCKERYRAPPPKPPTPPSEGQAGRKKRKRRRPRKPRKSGSRESPQGAQPPATNTDPPPRTGALAIGPSRRGPTPDGPMAKKYNTGQAPPAPSKPNQPSPELKPAAQGDSSWAARVRKGSQVSGSGGAAFSPTPK